jgi:hypothetical protein
MKKKVYEGYYCEALEESGLYERKEMKGYPKYLILDDVLSKEFHGNKLRITIEQLEVKPENIDIYIENNKITKFADGELIIEGDGVQVRRGSFINVEEEGK